MFKFICRTFPHANHSISRPSAVRKLFFLQLNSLSENENRSSSTTVFFINKCGFAPEKALEAPKYVNVDNPCYENQSSFTIDYLINKCGFAPEKALAASKYVNFDNPCKPDAVVSFFKSLGFTEAQVLKMIRYYPPVLLCDIQKTLLPKIRFFQCQGFSEANLAVVLTAIPAIFGKSLERNIRPSFNYLRNLLSPEDCLVTVRRSPALVTHLNSSVIPNIEILRNARVPEAKITLLLKHYPQSFINHPEKFKELVHGATRMGFDPLVSTFVVAVNVLNSLTKLNWKRKVELYQRWGLTEEELQMAFRTYPLCMLISVNKIQGIMEVLVNKMGWNSSILVRTPHILSFSLSKRISPRCSVYQALRSKGLVEEVPSSVYTFLKISEELFLQKYVSFYEKKAPGLLRLYKKELQL